MDKSRITTLLFLCHFFYFYGCAVELFFLFFMHLWMFFVELVVCILCALRFGFFGILYFFFITMEGYENVLSYKLKWVDFALFTFEFHKFHTDVLPSYHWIFTIPFPFFLCFGFSHLSDHKFYFGSLNSCLLTYYKTKSLD